MLAGDGAEGLVMGTCAVFAAIGAGVAATAVLDPTVWGVGTILGNALNPAPYVIRKR